jgi:ParB family chromosome partitioning protein
VRTKDNFFEIVAGNRRYHTCKLLGWKKIICHIAELDDKKAFEVSLTENIQRKSLDPIEEARAFKMYVNDFGWGGITDLASKISKSPSYISKRLDLLDLSPAIIGQIQNSDMSISVAEELLSIRDNTKRYEIAGLTVKNKLSSRKTRELVKAYRDMPENSVYESHNRVDDEDLVFQNRIIDIDTKVRRCFDKSITALKMAMSKIAYVIEDAEDDWIVYEILMQHKNMLNSQIDLLIKEKKKL